VLQWVQFVGNGRTDVWPLCLYLTGVLTCAARR